MTEVFAGVLSSAQHLLDKFVNDTLHIPGSNFVVETQVPYPNSRIDMLFENESSICFLENKVEAVAGYNQLKKYAELLLEQHPGKQGFLRYCTKYQDPKAPNDYEPLESTYFYQFRWKDVYAFFKKYHERVWVNAFLTLLEEMKMNSVPEFIETDLVAMREISNTLTKIEECFERITPQFTAYFGSPTSKLELRRWPRYEMRTSNIISGQSSAIYLAVRLYDEPIIYIACRCDKKNEQYVTYQALIEDSKRILPGITIGEDKWGLGATFSQPLSDFIGSPNQFKEIAHWCIEKMKVWRDFMRAHPQIKWTVPETDIAQRGQ